MPACIPLGRAPRRRDTEERRLVAHVCRELRRRQARAERGRGGGGPPGVALPELAALFPAFSEAAIGARLRERCNCQPLRVLVVTCSVNRRPMHTCPAAAMHASTGHGMEVCQPGMRHGGLAVVRVGTGTARQTGQAQLLSGYSSCLSRRRRSRLGCTC